MLRLAATPASRKRGRARAGAGLPSCCALAPPRDGDGAPPLGASVERPTRALRRTRIAAAAAAAPSPSPSPSPSLGPATHTRALCDRRARAASNAPSRALLSLSLLCGLWCAATSAAPAHATTGPFSLAQQNPSPATFLSLSVEPSENADYDLTAALGSGTTLSWRVQSTTTLSLELWNPYAGAMWFGFGLAGGVNGSYPAHAARVVVANATSCAVWVLGASDPAAGAQEMGVVPQAPQTNATLGSLPGAPLPLSCTVTRDSSGNTLAIVADGVWDTRFSLDAFSDQVVDTALVAWGFGSDDWERTYWLNSTRAAFTVDWVDNGLGRVYACLRVTHGILMLFAYGILLPVGILMPTIFKPNRQLRIKSVRVRDEWALSDPSYLDDPHELPAPSLLLRWFGRFRWLEAHKGINITALVLALFAFALVVPTVQPGTNFTQLHHVVGLAVLVATFVQPIAAKCRPHDTDFIKSSARLQWEMYHRVFGLGIVALAFTNMWIGVGVYANFLAPVLFQESLIWGLFYAATLPLFLWWATLYIVVKGVRSGAIPIPGWVMRFVLRTRARRASEAVPEERDAYENLVESSANPMFKARRGGGPAAGPGDVAVAVAGAAPGPKADAL